MVAASVILEEIHHQGCNAAACHAQMYTMGTVLRHGSDEQKKKYLPEILGKVLARIWIDSDFKTSFKENPIQTLNDHGVYLPDDMVLEFQKPDTKRPKIIVYEKKGKSNFKVRVVQLQLIMMVRRNHTYLRKLIDPVNIKEVVGNLFTKFVKV